MRARYTISPRKHNHITSSPTVGAEAWAASGGSQQHGPAETVSQSDLGSSITSGGGFSEYYTAATAPWQAKAVSTYFTNAAQAGKTPLSGYKVGHRGYPDVSLNGVNYQYYVGGATYKASGTSASTQGYLLTDAFFAPLDMHPLTDIL